jgi:hypothetical protein
MNGVSASEGLPFAWVQQLIAIAVLALFTQSCFGITMPEIPHAPDMRIVVVSDHMVYNGIDMATYEISSPHPIEEVLRFYRQAWHGVVAEAPMTMGLDSEQWTVLSHRENEFLVTLQLHPSKPEGVYGYIAVSNLFRGGRREFGRDVLIPAGSKLIQDIVSDDLGRHCRTVVVQNENSVSFNLDFYRQRLLAEGWTEVTDFSKLPKGMENPQALMMNRGDDELNLAVTRSAGMSTVVMVTVHK